MMMMMMIRWTDIKKNNQFEKNSNNTINDTYKIYVKKIMVIFIIVVNKTIKKKKLKIRIQSRFNLIFSVDGSS